MAKSSIVCWLVGIALIIVADLDGAYSVWPLLIILSCAEDPINIYSALTAVFVAAGVVNLLANQSSNATLRAANKGKLRSAS